MNWKQQSSTFSHSSEPAGCCVAELDWSTGSRLHCFSSSLDWQLPSTCGQPLISHPGAQSEAAMANGICCSFWGPPKCRKANPITQVHTKSLLLTCGLTSLWVKQLRRSSEKSRGGESHFGIMRSWQWISLLYYHHLVLLPTLKSQLKNLTFFHIKHNIIIVFKN